MRRYSVVCTVLAVILIVSLFGVGHAADDRPIMATERWESIADGGKGRGVWTFSQRSDGTVLVAGEWTYEGSITCPFTAGGVQISGPSFSFTVTGTATSSFAPEGYRESPFTLEVKGEARGGEGKGTYVITFAAEKWPPGLSGKWQATRREGEGVTE